MVFASREKLHAGCIVFYNMLCVNEFMGHRFPESLKRLRKERKWTQDDLAERIGLHKNMIVRYEAHQEHPQFINLMRLIDALECSPNDILGWEPGAKMRCPDDLEAAEEPEEPLITA